MKSSPQHSRDISIFDAHIHLWDLDRNYYPWLRNGSYSSTLGDYSSLRRNYLITDFLQDAADLDLVGCVHVQAQHDPADHIRETRWLQEVADERGSRGMPRAIVGNADLASDEIRAVLEGHCAFRNMRGIRQSLNRRLEEVPSYDPLLDEAWRRNFPLLAEFGLSFDMELIPEQADHALPLIRDNPDVQVIFTHAGIPFKRDPDSIRRWRQAIVRYAELPNTAIKISGFGVFMPDWTADSVDPVISPVIEAFTPARCMLASNFPVEGLRKKYTQVWKDYFEFFSGYSKSEVEMLFWRNAKKFYRVDCD